MYSRLVGQSSNSTSNLSNLRVPIRTQLDVKKKGRRQVSYAEVKATTLAVMAKDIALNRNELSMWSQARV